MIYLLFFLLTLSVLAVFLYQLQYFFIFEPHKYPREQLDERFKALEIKTKDGVLLEGVEYSPAEFTHTLLYFGGRSQDSVALIKKLSENYSEYRIITFNYRGYGDSKGVLSEKIVFEDALFVARKLQEHYGTLSLMGYSLGSSLAAFAATSLKLENLFLIGAFKSVSDVMKRRVPLLPTFMIKYRFDTALHVRDVESPSYLIVSKTDEIIPFKSAYALSSCIKNLAEFKELYGYNHDEILFSPETTALVKRVLQ
jgi:hypothetical protein